VTDLRPPFPLHRACRHQIVSGFRETADGTAKENSMHDHHTANANSPREAIAPMSRSLDVSLGQSRAFLDEMMRFAKNESLHLAQKQLDHANNAFIQFGACRAVAGLVDAQQEWAKLVMQDYASLGLRYAEMFHALTQRIQSEVQAGAKGFAEEVEDMRADVAAQAMAAAHAGLKDGQNHPPVQ
jgi:hypothetical protein